MSRQVNYTGEHISIGSDTTTPEETVQYILGLKSLPNNFIKLSEASKAYKETVLAMLLLQVNDREELLDTMCSFMRGVPEGGTSAKVITEYAASIAYALDDKELAINIITRSQPGEVGQHVWSIVSAIKKGMPGLMYQTMVTSNLPLSKAQWETSKDLVLASI